MHSGGRWRCWTIGSCEDVCSWRGPAGFSALPFCTRWCGSRGWVSQSRRHPVKVGNIPVVLEFLSCVHNRVRKEKFEVHVFDARVETDKCDALLGILNTIFSSQFTTYQRDIQSQFAAISATFTVYGWFGCVSWIRALRFQVNCICLIRESVSESAEQRLRNALSRFGLMDSEMKDWMDNRITVMKGWRYIFTKNAILCCFQQHSHGLIVLDSLSVLIVSGAYLDDICSFAICIHNAPFCSMHDDDHSRL